MKTEFNVERVCERVHMCVVEAPDNYGEPLIEMRNGSVHVSFPKAEKRHALGTLMRAALSESLATEKQVIDAALAESNAQNAPEAGSIAKPKRRGK